MMDNIDLAQFKKSPKLLIEILQNVIKELGSERILDDFTNKQSQLREIARTIDKLDKSKITIPDELRNLKTNLATDLAKQEEVVAKLTILLEGIKSTVHLLNEILIKYKIKGKNRSTVRSFKPKTPKSVLREEIIKILKERRGSESVQNIINSIEKQLEGKLLPRDLETTSNGVIIWKNRVNWERHRMVKEGLLKNNSPRGIWELNEDYE